MMGLLAAGMLAGIIVRPLLVPWLLASGLFLVNYVLSLIFLKAMSRLSSSAAAGVAVLSFVIRFGLLGLALIGVALGLKEQFLTTAICFLLVYTLFLVLEIAVGLKGRPATESTTAGGEA